MCALTARTKDNRRYTCRRQESSVHPASCTPHCWLSIEYSLCLATHNLNNEFILGYFKWFSHNCCFHGSFEMWISCSYSIRYAAYLSFNALLCLTGNSAPFYAQHTPFWIAGKLLTARNQ